MRYLALLYWEEDRRPTPASPDFDSILGAYADASRSFESAGVLIDANPLENVDSAVSVRVRDGKTLVTDGPFAETKERLGGYYLFECADMDEALRLSEQIPAVYYGKVEVRPILEIDLPEPG